MEARPRYGPWDLIFFSSKGLPFTSFLRSIRLCLQVESLFFPSPLSHFGSEPGSKFEETSATTTLCKSFLRNRPPLQKTALIGAKHSPTDRTLYLLSSHQGVRSCKRQPNSRTESQRNKPHPSPNPKGSHSSPVSAIQCVEPTSSSDHPFASCPGRKP